MPVYFASRALLPTGWAHNVRFDVNTQGFLLRVTPNASDDGCLLLNGIAVPGMPNLHSHAFQRAMAGLAEVAGKTQDNFWTWRDLMYRLVQRLDPAQIEVIACQLYIEMLKGGYTHVAEFHYLHHAPEGKPYANRAEIALRLSEAAAQVGIGLTLLPVLYSYSGFGAQPAQPSQQRFIQDIDGYLVQQQAIACYLSDKTLQNYGICFHSLRAVAPEQMVQLLAELDHQLPVHIHIAEQRKEVIDCLAWCGQRPVAWLLSHFALDKRWCLVHATHLDEHEIIALAKSGAVAGLCPTTEANLGDGIFPGSDYLRYGGSWGIGSDSHVSVDVVEELRWLEYGQRLRDQQRNRLVCAQQSSVGDLIYPQAALGGAQACSAPIGQLDVGFRADWLILDEDDPYLAVACDNTLLNRWLFAGNKAQIRDVYVAGRQVITLGQHMFEQQSRIAFTKVLKAISQEI